MIVLVVAVGSTFGFCSRLYFSCVRWCDMEAFGRCSPVVLGVGESFFCFLGKDFNWLFWESGFPSPKRKLVEAAGVHGTFAEGCLGSAAIALLYNLEC